MGTQKAIAAQIVENKADYVLALKGNQESLHDAVVDDVDQQIQTDFANVTARTHTTQDKGYGRKETRTYIQLPVPAALPGASHWKGLKTIGLVISICLRNGKETVETHYYLSSLGLGVKQFARAVRSHWSLDVTYREDAPASGISTRGRISPGSTADRKGQALQPARTRSRLHQQGESPQSLRVRPEGGIGDEHPGELDRRCAGVRRGSLR
ncbi:ISAs1 family transposase [Planctomicrobium sp. SH527]|uniref:ISAs1 family transposase n=1 Tax=Planctomicrobium sp. SH527 TaxID=3448123 RepID=UPI003F5C2467